MKRTLILASLLSAIAACKTAPVARPKVAKAPPPPAAAPAPKAEVAPEPVSELVDPYEMQPIEDELVAEEPADPSCPMSVADTTVAFVETERGAALMFETPTVAEVQTRLDAIAMDHNESQPPRPIPGTEGSDEWGERDDTVLASGGVEPAAATARLPRVSTPSQATVEISSTGVRLSYRAEAEHVEALREELRAQAVILASGRCDESM
jgi:hypothetical protein